jgi:hypothetical protein
LNPGVRTQLGFKDSISLPSQFSASKTPAKIVVVILRAVPFFTRGLFLQESEFARDVGSHIAHLKEFLHKKFF